MIPLNSFSMHQVGQEFLVMTQAEYAYTLLVTALLAYVIGVGVYHLFSDERKLKMFIIEQRLAQDYHEWEIRIGQERMLAKYGRDYCKSKRR